MAEDWTGIAEEVAAALDEVGFTATLVRPGTTTGPEYDPVQLPASKHPIRVMLDAIGLGLIDGTAIRASDKRVMMAAEGIEPTTADRIVLAHPDTVTVPENGTLPGMAVTRCEPFAPGGVNLYLDLVLRA